MGRSKALSSWIRANEYTAIVVLASWLHGDDVSESEDHSNILDIDIYDSSLRTWVAICQFMPRGQNVINKYYQAFVHFLGEVQ